MENEIKNQPSKKYVYDNLAIPITRLEAVTYPTKGFFLYSGDRSLLYFNEHQYDLAKGIAAEISRAQKEAYTKGLLSGVLKPEEVKAKLRETGFPL